MTHRDRSPSTTADPRAIPALNTRAGGVSHAAGTGLREGQRQRGRDELGIPLPARRQRLQASANAAASRPRRPPPRHSTARSNERARSRASPRPRHSTELVEMYLAQHDTEPETIEKLRWLLSKATARFGNTPISELAPAEIAAWRMTIPYGHRFEARQALRQTLARAVSWGMLNTTRPSKASPTDNDRASSSTRSNPGTNSRLSRTGSDGGSSRGPVRRRDRAETKRMARARTARHRPPGTRRVRPPRLPQRPDQMPQDRRQHSRRPAPINRARGARRAPEAATGQRSYSRPRAAAISTCTTSVTATGSPPSANSGRPDQKDLRSQTFLRYVRAPRRHLNLRPLPLHGRQPHDDRPALRPPR